MGPAKAPGAIAAAVAKAINAKVNFLILPPGFAVPLAHPAQSACKGMSSVRGSCIQLNCPTKKSLKLLRKLRVEFPIALPDSFWLLQQFGIAGQLPDLGGMTLSLSLQGSTNPCLSYMQIGCQTVFF
jgi:hypothetical protein